MAKDDSTARCFQGLLIFGNVIVGMCGIALTAECIFFVSDQHSLYPLLEATDNDDIYGAAWIGMFVGICLFCLSVLGIVGIMKSNRKILLAYFILMFIVYGFEVASCITAATQRDFFTPNLFLKQMLERYQNNSPPNNDDQWKNNGVTKTWDRLMLQDNCCGVNGPSDWQKYTSAFRTENNDADYPWPRQCCVMDSLKKPLNLEACKLGVPGYYHKQTCLGGCLVWICHSLLDFLGSPGYHVLLEQNRILRMKCHHYTTFLQRLWTACCKLAFPVYISHLSPEGMRAFLLKLPSQLVWCSSELSASQNSH
ncbi:uroplakin-1b isoform X1 [Panthera tigris]|uniref:uroplakin-1b isoform X1 n=1 Tax=Panthera tigris TaxID=9694 RepID=UPI001C6F761D|nr:uroplakin-1b isoform X1 [Panthera tigris]